MEHSGKTFMDVEDLRSIVMWEEAADTSLEQRRYP